MWGGVERESEDKVPLTLLLGQGFPTQGTVRNHTGSEHLPRAEPTAGRTLRGWRLEKGASGRLA